MDFRPFQARTDRFTLTASHTDDYGIEIAAAGFAKQKLSLDLRRDPVPAPLDIVLKLDDLSSCGPEFDVGYRALDAAHSHVVGLILVTDKKYHSKPVSHAQIALKAADAREWAYEARSDKKGEFRFGEIPAGRYDVRISRDGYEVFELKRLMAPRANALYIKGLAAQARRVHRLSVMFFGLN